MHTMATRRAIYPGTFDPITLGHIDIIERAADLFDEVVVAIAQNSNKKAAFSLEQRIDMAKEALKAYTNVTIEGFNELLIDFAMRHDIHIIIRGLRAVADFEYEYQLASMNRQLAPNIETLFLTPSGENGSISSSLVREIASFGGDVSAFVPDNVVGYLKKLIK